MTRHLVAILLLIFALPAAAQDDADAEHSVFTAFIERQLSTPNRQIRISGIHGALSSNATIRQITVADRQGVWLRINDASIVWSRSALILRQRLEIESLSAASIEMPRRPVPAEGLPAPEARGFSIPELPIAVNLGQLDVPSVTFGQGVFGLASELSVEGRLRLEGGSLDTQLAVERLDGPGGSLRLSAGYAAERETLDLDLSLSEPQNGVVANLLNIEGRPPLSLRLAGAGPLGDLDLAMSLETAGQPALQGTARFRRRQEGLGFTVDASGPIVRLVPARYRGFFGAETALTATGVAQQDGGGFLLENLSLTSAALKLEAAAETSSDGFLRTLSLDAAVDDPEAETVLLPVAGGETTVGRATLSVSYGEADSERWSSRLDIADLTTGVFSAEAMTLTMGGAAENLDRPQDRHITFEVDGDVTGIVSQRPEVAEALGETIRLRAEGGWSAGAPLEVRTARLEGSSLTLALAGVVADYAFRGDIDLDAAGLAPFSGLAGRQLSGAVTLTANGAVHPVTGAFDLTLDGTARELAIDEPVVDRLLAGETVVDGRLARSTEGLAADGFRLANEQLTLTADGTYATGAADFDLDVSLADAALVTDQVAGKVTASGSANGGEGLINVTLTALMPQGRLVGKPLHSAALAFDGYLQDGNLDGSIAGNGFVDGRTVSLNAGIAFEDGARRLSDLVFSAGDASASGDLLVRANGLIEGELAVEATDISTAAALFLQEASGAADARLRFDVREGRQHAEANGTVRQLVSEWASIDTAEFSVRIDDLFGVPVIDGSLGADGLTAAGIDVARLDAEASRTDQTSQFNASARLVNGADIAARGALAPEDGGYRVSLQSAEIAQGQLAARLTEPASVLIDGRDVVLDVITLDVAGGAVTARGQVRGDDLDLSLTAQQVPLSIANAVRPDLELGGTLDGSARVTGTRSAPQVEFDIDGRNVSAATLRAAGLSTIAVDATGTTAGERLTIDGRITSPEGLNATVTGQAPLGGGALDLDVRLEAFPLAVLDAAVRGQNLAGRVSGTAHISGPPANPQATFDLNGTDVRAQALSELGIAPLQLTANGRFADGAVMLSGLRASGPQGLSITASGQLPISGSGVALDVDGTAPLSLANRQLATRGTRLSGTLSLDAKVSGALRQPQVNGTISTSAAQAIDPLSNLRLTNIQLSAVIAGETVTIRSASAALARGGNVSVSGSISTNAAAGFPADLRMQLNEARYSDGELVTATLSGALALNGPLARDPLLSGEITVDRAEILVPENLSGGADAIDVVHKNTPRDVQQTLARARADDGTPMPGSRPSVMRLDVQVNAPARVFVRGRGLDAELGGSVRLTGPVTGIQPVGGFDLIRGRLSILTQRISFEEGSVTLIGDLDPYLDFVARSQGRDIVVFITVRGRVSDLDITFSSQPELPEDEVLARLIFNRSISELSPLQLARLAAAAAELAGGSDTSLLGQLRGAVGLDDLDIVTDQEGNAAVRAGRYIQENIYLGVEAGAQGTTRGTINLDITEDLKARGALGSDGNSSLGIFYEKDY